MSKLMLTDLKKACEEQRQLFRQNFGAGGEVTRAKILSVAHLFDLGWAANNLLTKSGRAEYERVEGPARAEYARVEGPAWTEYQRVRGLAWAEYERAQGPARAEYERVEGLARAEYERAQGPARAEYQRVEGPAWTEYQRVRGLAFWAGWKVDHPPKKRSRT